jgi:TolB-like protein
MAADEQQTMAALDAAREVFRSESESHQGRVVDTAGDSVLAIFETASGALSAGLAVQQRLDAASSAIAEERKMRFRIGVHLGDVMEKGDGSVYGDGVNIASRLQTLAAPGGIMVSEAIRGAAKNAVTFEDHGNQTVKNIAAPVHAFSVRMASAVPHASAWLTSRRRYALLASGLAALVVAGAAFWIRPWAARVTTEGQTAGALSLPARPSIAVLPFENMSGDPEQTYFADGMTEDLITDLSKVAGLFVIARNSTFVYKGKSRDVREIARTLGVRYVLEGSVRRSGNDVRVNAQLIDATTGGHVWADRYDGDLKNIFGLQDKVARNVVGALAVELTKDDRDRVARRGTANAEAYDVFLKGWQHYLRQTPEDFRAAIVHFNKAAELDPKYARAYAALAATYWDASTRVWDTALGLERNHEAQLVAQQFLAKAMGDPTPLAHQVASAIALQRQQYDDAIAEANKAIAGDPNDADGYVILASAMSFTGKPAEALELVDRAIRLNPHYPPHYLYQRGLAQFGLKRLDVAAGSLERALELNHEDYWSQRLLLSTYGALGRRDKAAKLLAEMNRAGERRGRSAYLDPITIKAVSYWYPFAIQADAERFAEGLRKAGVSD